MQELITKARNTYFIPLARLDLDEEYQDLNRRVPTAFQSCCEHHLQQLHAVIDTASLPFLMACTSVHLEIPYLKQQGDDLKNAIALRLSEELCDSIQHPSTLKAHQELLRQSCVLLWSTEEVFLKNFIALLIDHKPFLIDRMLLSDKAKRRIAKSIPMQVLEQYGFNVSEHLGDILCFQHGNHGIYFSKSILEAVWPFNKNLHSALANPTLWKLHDKRNLIVHGQGIDDAATRIFIGPDEYQSYLDAILAIAVEIMKALLEPIP